MMSRCTSNEIVLYTKRLSTKTKNEESASNFDIENCCEKKTNAGKKFSWNQVVYLFILFFAAFVNYTALSVVAPFPQTESSNEGISESTVGLIIFSFYAFVVFISSPVYGILIPKFGVKLIFVTGLVISGICNIIFGLLYYVEDYYVFTGLCFAIRGIGAVGCSATINAEFAIVSSLFPYHGGYVRGLLETSVGLGLGTGPAIGDLMFSIGDFGLSFYAIGCLMLFNALTSFFIFPQNEESEIKRAKCSLRFLLKATRIILGCLTVLISSSTWSFLDPTLEPHLRKFDLDPVYLDLIILLPETLYGISSPIWIKLVDKLSSYWWLMSTGLFLNALSLMFFGPFVFLSFIQDSIWLHVITLAMIGIFSAMDLVPTYQSILDGALECGFEENEITHGFVTGLWTTSNALGEIIGPAIGDAILDHYSFPTATSVMSVFNLVISIATFLYFMRSKTEQ